MAEMLNEGDLSNLFTIEKQTTNDIITHNKGTRENEIEFDLPLVDSFKQLVNNGHLADIRFKVGQSGELIYAHKLIITTASEVFYTQFYGGFAESQRDTLIDPVVIEDIEPAPFLELLRYIYCREVNIQPSNLMDIYYASEKYILKNLGIICEDNFYRQINETTVMEVFQHNRRYGFPVVDTLCLKIICDNPLKYFKQEEFLRLSKQAVQLIASSHAMNCRVDQLVQAIEHWQQCNGKTAIEVQLQKPLCPKLYFFDKCAYSSNIDSRFVVNARAENESIALYGMGIYVGVEKDSPMPNSTVHVCVDLNGFSVRETFPIMDELIIYEILFEKQLIGTKCEISVKVVQQGTKKKCKMFHLNGWSTMDATILKVKGFYSRGHCNNCGYTEGDRCSYCRGSQINCVAYLLCSRGKRELSNSA